MVITDTSRDPAILNIDLVRGDDFQGMVITLPETIPLSGLSVARMDIVDNIYSNRVVHSLSLGNGITVDNQNLVFSISKTVTATFEAETHKYDCELTIAGVTRTYFAGDIIVKGDVTI